MAHDGADVVRIGKHNDAIEYGTRRFFKGNSDELRLYGAAWSLGNGSVG